jgi:quercetin 2,3-dioxygenase
MRIMATNLYQVPIDDSSGILVCMLKSNKRIRLIRLTRHKNNTVMSVKLIEQVLAAPAPHMVGDGFRVHNFFPSGYSMGLKRMSPFFMMDYNSKVDFPPTDTPRGVGVHPHRGFETVTLAYHGSVAHHDSAGHSGVVHPGDVQWMTAASGVLHKEYHDQAYSQKGGLFQMVQLWVNLPKAHKMSSPKYQAITQAEMGKYELPESQGVVEVIAGRYQDVAGAASTFSPIEMYNIRLKAGATVAFSLPATYNTGILVVEGAVTVNGQSDAAVDHFVLFGHEGEAINIEAKEDTILLLLSGEPIDEPIAAYGSFLMNTNQELMQAIDDVNQGKFGYLAD